MMQPESEQDEDMLDIFEGLGLRDFREQDPIPDAGKVRSAISSLNR